MKLIASIFLLWTISTLGNAAPIYLTKPIVNIRNNNKIHADELPDMFLLNTTYWPDGSKITVFVLVPYHPLGQTFLMERLGLNLVRYDEITAIRLAAGTANPPIVVNNEYEMISEVAATVGGIGYVGYNTLLHPSDGAKVITFGSPIKKAP